MSNVNKCFMYILLDKSLTRFPLIIRAWVRANRLVSLLSPQHVVLVHLQMVSCVLMQQGPSVHRSPSRPSPRLLRALHLYKAPNLTTHTTCWGISREWNEMQPIHSYITKHAHTHTHRGDEPVEMRAGALRAASSTHQTGWWEDLTTDMEWDVTLSTPKGHSLQRWQAFNRGSTSG